jgi:predicted secreted hydrolase
VKRRTLLRAALSPVLGGGGPLPLRLSGAGAAALLAAAPPARAGLPDYETVRAGQPLVFPRDFGAHPGFRTEWWYATGWLQTGADAPLGFQITFFRSRVQTDESNPSRFAPTQLLFAHAALSDPRLGRLQTDQRAARAGFGLAYARALDTDVALGDWSLRRGGDGRYALRLPAREFTFVFTMTPRQEVMLQGENGYSRKGPEPSQASYYYSQPVLAVDGTLTRHGRDTPVRGTAWLDHEWSSSYLARQAAGWDWIGIRLDDGGALMAFRIRDRAGATFWAGGTWRDAGGRVTTLRPADIAMHAERYWSSPRTGARYPVAMQVQAGPVRFALRPLLDDQELDTGQTTGAVYWEGAVSVVRDGATVGQGYLELTGYVGPLNL